MLKLIQGLNEILWKHFIFVVGISIVSLCTTMLKCFLVKAYIIVHKFDINFLSEKYLESSTQPDDDILEIAGYDRACVDHPMSIKRGRIHIH